MGRKEKRKKNAELRRRYDSIKSLMSTFAMSTVAVVAVVTLIPASPKAEITKSVALNEEIVYQVEITDEENSLDLDTLFVVLENQSEYYEHPIELGSNSGYFTDLNPETEYRLSVYGSKGFGQERLDTIILKTKDKIGGTILSVVKTNDEFPVYNVDFRINDPNNQYNSLILYYGVIDEEFPDEVFYNQILLTPDETTKTISDLYMHGAIHIYLEAETNEGTLLLDEITVPPTFELMSSVYLDEITNNSVSFHQYGHEYIDELSFKIETYKNNFLLKTTTFTPKQNEYEGSKIKIEELLPNTNYEFKVTALYKNPYTLRKEEKLIFEEQVTTLKNYSYTYSISETETNYEILIEVTDPEQYFQNISYEVLDLSNEYPIFLTFGDAWFTEIDSTKTATLIIEKPVTDKYQITVDIKNEVDSKIREKVVTIYSD